MQTCLPLELYGDSGNCSRYQPRGVGLGGGGWWSGGWEVPRRAEAHAVRFRSSFHSQKMEGDPHGPTFLYN